MFQMESNQLIHLSRHLFRWTVLVLLAIWSYRIVGMLLVKTMIESNSSYSSKLINPFNFILLPGHQMMQLFHK